MEVLESIFALVITISILVTIHEFGHFWVARLCGVKVLRFSIGFGKPLFTYRAKPVRGPDVPEGQEVRTRSNENLGTEFVIAALPLGGYVKMLDEREGFVADDEKHLSFNSKSVGKRIAIVSAGPIANFLLAIFAYWVLFATGVTGIVPLLGEIDATSPAGLAGFRKGQEIIKVDGEPTATWADVNLELFKRLGDTGQITFQVRASGSEAVSHPVISVTDWLASAETPMPANALGLALHFPDIPPTIARLVEGGRAESVLEVGDRILDAAGERVETWQQWVEIIQRHPETRIDLRVSRNDAIVYLEITPASIERAGKTIGFIGAARQDVPLPDYMQRKVVHSVFVAWIPAIEKTWSMTVFTLSSVKKMIEGTISPKNLSGPITIARIANATAKSGFESYISFIALLSISLGVLNLLPIPVLDGGHLLYYLIELVAGRPVPEKVQLIGLQFGVFLIVSIMLLAFYNDIARFF